MSRIIPACFPFADGSQAKPLRPSVATVLSIVRMGFGVVGVRRVDVWVVGFAVVGVVVAGNVVVVTVGLWIKSPNSASVGQPL